MQKLTFKSFKAEDSTNVGEYVVNAEFNEVNTFCLRGSVAKASLRFRNAEQVNTFFNDPVKAVDVTVTDCGAKVTIKCINKTLYVDLESIFTVDKFVYPVETPEEKLKRQVVELTKRVEDLQAKDEEKLALIASLKEQVVVAQATVDSVRKQLEEVKNKNSSW